MVIIPGKPEGMVPSGFLFIHFTARDFLLEKGVRVVIEFHEVIGGRVSRVGAERSV